MGSISLDDLVGWARHRVEELLTSLRPDDELWDLLPDPTQLLARPVPGDTAAPPPPSAQEQPCVEDATATATEELAEAPVELADGPAAAGPTDAPPRGPKSEPPGPQPIVRQSAPASRPAPAPAQTRGNTLEPAQTKTIVTPPNRPGRPGPAPISRAAPQPVSIHDARRGRRAHTRVPAQHPVMVRHDSWDDFVQLYTKDISRSGLFIRTEHPPPIGTELRLRVSLPQDGGMLRLRATVVHAVAPEQAAATGALAGVGVRVAGLTPGRKQMLEQLLRRARDEIATCAPPPSERPAGHDERTEQALLTDLRSTLAALQEREDLEVLRLTGHPTVPEIREAFMQLAQQWHPTVSNQYSTPDARKLATEIFLRLEQAYRRLTTTQPPSAPAAPEPENPANEPTLATASSSREPPIDAYADPVEPALTDASSSTRTRSPRNNDFVKAVLQRSRRAAGPRRTFDPSAASTLEQPTRPPSPDRTDPNRQAATTALSDGVKLMGQKRYDEAIAALQTAVRLRPGHDRAQILLYFAEARRFIADKKYALARAKYEAVLELDPENTIAKRDLVMIACMD